MNAEGSEKTTPSFATDLTGAPRVGSDEFFYDIFGIKYKGPEEYLDSLKTPCRIFRRRTPARLGRRALAIDQALVGSDGHSYWPTIHLGKRKQRDDCDVPDTGNTPRRHL